MTEILHIDGRREVIDTPMTTQEMRDIVGGEVEVVYLPNDKYLIVNSNRQGLSRNLTASNIAGRLLVGRAIFTDQLK